MSKIVRHRAAKAAVAISALATIAMGAKAQDTPPDVKPDHWAYEAVSDLAKKGLIKGYPPDGRFLGGRTLTRYEMATIIKRVLDRMDEIVKSPKGVSQDDFNTLKASVAEIQRLTEEFKTQLAVIGTDLTGVKNDLTALKGQVNDLSARVDTFDTRINTLSTSVDATTLLTDQALAGIKELRDQVNGVNAALAKKVDVGVGKLRIGGLIQNWYGTSFGKNFGGNFGPAGNFAASPPGRNFGGGVGDTFRLRRGEIALLGSPAPKVDFRVMFDLAKTGTGATAPLQDLWVGYQLAPRFRVEIGAQKPDLSEEGNRSPVLLLTVERSIMNLLPPNAGLSGTQRDTGAVARYRGALANVSVGIWNDNGAAENSVDNDRFKFGTLAANFTGVRYLTFGLWGGHNIGDYQPRNIRDRAGATLILNYHRSFAEGEFVYAEDRFNNGPRNRAMGGYALYAYSLSKRWQLVGRYDEWDPSVHGGVIGPGGPTVGRDRHNLREYTFGVNYYIRGHNAKIQLNYIIDDTQGNGVAFFGARRQILLSNFQTAWY